ncbi:Signal peptidase I [hydrothermal vent metagenome]|uniref:Signal peptidase I n=1 Tax=hydrothermal vent metagenome TaxID=652676 RepID=A0A3B1AV88_9ZZZZ
MDDSAGLIGPLIMLAILIFFIASFWKIYTKAGQPGWACIIPIYNTIVLLKIAGRPWWWLLLMFIPLVNFIIIIIFYIDIAKSFGKGVGFGLGLIFLGIIFFPILGFGSATYVGPAAEQS